MPNGKHLPLALLPKQARGWEIGLGMFAFKDNLPLASWHPNPSKHVPILSSLHHSTNIAESGKPEIAEFYNKTKTGVDTLDQKVRHYSTYHKTYRWPLAVFYNIFDISAYNSYILYKVRPLVAGKDGSSLSCFKFLAYLVKN